MGREDLVGHGEYAHADWDLVEVVMVCLDPTDPSGHDGVLGMLGTLLSTGVGPEEKLESLARDYDMIMTERLEEGVSEMCNLSEGVRQDSKQERLLEDLRNLMETMQMDAARAMDILKVPAAERQELALML